MNQFAWTFPGGKLKQEVTSVTLVNNTELIIDKTVPAGKIWILLCISFSNVDDADRIVRITKWKEAGKTNLIKVYINQSVSLGTEDDPDYWPHEGIATAKHEMPTGFELLAAGNTIETIWAAGGASNGGTDTDGLVLEYLEIDTP